MGKSAEAASNAETAVTQLVQLFTIRAQVLVQGIWASLLIGPLSTSGTTCPCVSAIATYAC